MKISDVFPNPDDLLALEPEELAEVLLRRLQAVVEERQRSNPSTRESFDVNFHNFFNQNNYCESPPEFGSRQPEVDSALMEAWSWLESAGLLARSRDSTAGLFFITRRGRAIKSPNEFLEFRRGTILRRHLLHNTIADRVYPAFLRGEYDTAIFQAFREVEVAVRKACGFGSDQFGDKLMRSAFGSKGVLTDQSVPVGEQEAMGHLFAGAFGVHRNATGHRHVPTDPAEAAEIIGLASYLLRVVDRLTSGNQLSQTP